jgi:hypothetical protein
LETVLVVNELIIAGHHMTVMRGPGPADRPSQDVSERRRKEEAALAIVVAGRAEAETASTSLLLQ